MRLSRRIAEIFGFKEKKGLKSIKNKFLPPCILLPEACLSAIILMLKPGAVSASAKGSASVSGRERAGERVQSTGRSRAKKTIKINVRGMAFEREVEAAVAVVVVVAAAAAGDGESK